MYELEKEWTPMLACRCSQRNGTSPMLFLNDDQQLKEKHFIMILNRIVFGEASLLKADMVSATFTHS